MEARIMKKSLISLILCGALSAAVLAGCAKPEAPAVDEAEASAIASQVEEIVSEEEDIFGSYEETEPLDYVKPTQDRAGVPIEVPDQVDRIVSLAPSTTQFLIELGLSDKIVGIESRMDKENADNARRNILSFDDELRRGMEHSEESFNQVLQDIKYYRNFCRTHADYENDKATSAITHIRETYQRVKNENKFI